jgi:tetratricopeptide (TPR) repeat protein
MNTSAPAKLGRNDPCPCGSGKKYKACCFQDEAKFHARSASALPVWLQYAQQAAAQGDFQNAEAWFRRVLDAKPTDALALAGVGQCLCWQGRRKEGTGYLLKAAKQLERQAQKSREPGHLVELSGQLQHWGEMDAALRLARLAVRLAPKSAAAQNNLGMALSRVNRNDEALPPVRKACELLPGHPGCNILLALLDSRQKRFAEARERLDRVISTSREPEQTARAWLELATVLDKQQAYDPAFAALEQAAALHRALPAYHAADRERIFNTLAANQAGFDAGLLKCWPAADLQAGGLPAPVFLLGFLRSGTTLTEQVLGAHPGVVTSDESPILFELNHAVAKLSGVTGDVAAGLRQLDIAAARHIRALYWRRVREEYGAAALNKVFIDKNAMNTIDLGLISAIFPDAKILFALRDPRDICLSCYMQAFDLAPATVNLLSWEGISRQYAAVMDFWLAKRDAIAPVYLELRYEGTVLAFEATYRRVFTFLDLEWRPEVLAFHEKAQGRFIATPSFAAVSQPLYNSAVARWTRYEKHFAQVLPVLERFILAFGYMPPKKLA